jgi:outer membrane protein assembly factor BamB
MKPPQVIRLPQKYRQLHAPLLYDGGSVYVTNLRTTVALERGSMVFRWAIPGSLEAVIGDTIVLRRGAKDQVLGLAAEDRRERWRTPDYGRSAGTWNDHVLFAGDGTVTMLSPVTGAATEVSQPLSPTFVGPVTGDTLLLAEAKMIDHPCAPRACAVDLRSREVRWDRLVGEPVEGARGTFLRGDLPTGLLFFLYGDTLSACSLANGDVRWQMPCDAKADRCVVAGDVVLHWSGGRLTGRHAMTGTVVFETNHEPLGPYSYPRLGLVHEKLALILMGGRMEVIDLADGAVVNEYERMTAFSDAVMIDGRLVVLTYLDLRVFDDSIWARPKARKLAARPRVAKPPVFKSQRLIAQVLGEVPDEAMVFETQPPISVPGVNELRVPVVAGDTVLVGARSTGLYALAAPTYQFRWQQPDGPQEPDVHAGFIISRAWPSTVLRGWAVETGQLAWLTDCDDRFFPSGDFIVVSAESGREVRLFDPSAGEVVTAFTAPLPILAGVSEKVAVMCDAGPGNIPWTRPNRNPVVGIDLRDGRELWRRHINSNADPLDDEPRIEAVEEGVVVCRVGDRLEGRSVHTGDISWEAPGRWSYRAGHLWWRGSYEQKRFEVLDITTGRVTVIPVEHGGGAILSGTYDGYVLAPATRGLFFFHHSRPAQLLPIKLFAVGDTKGVQVREDLILNEQGKLRLLRRTR